MANYICVERIEWKRQHYFKCVLLGFGVDNTPNKTATLRHAVRQQTASSKQFIDMRPMCWDSSHHSLCDNGQFELKEKCCQGVSFFVIRNQKGCSNAASFDVII